MADLALSDFDNQVYVGGPPHSKDFKTNGTDVYPGAVVAADGESAPDVDLASQGDAAFIGVAGLKRGQEIDTAYGDNVSIPVYIRGSGTEVWVRLIANSGAIKPGDYMRIAAEDGKVDKWTYTDAATGTDTLAEVVGISVQFDAGHATDDRWIRIKL